VKRKHFLIAAALLLFTLYLVGTVWALDSSKDSGPAGEDFSAIEKELEKAIQEGKISIPSRPSFEENEEPTELCEGMSHWVTYSAKGSRSEARHGFIGIEGYTVPDVFTSLVYKGIGVTFSSRSYHWGDDGYWPSAKVAVPEVEGPSLSETDKETGWKITDKRPAGLPENWVYVEWEEGAAFVAPDRLKDFVDAMQLPLLERYGERMEMSRDELEPKENSD